MAKSNAKRSGGKECDGLFGAGGHNVLRRTEFLWKFSHVFILHYNGKDYFASFPRYVVSIHLKFTIELWLIIVFMYVSIMLATSEHVFLSLFI